MALKKVPILLLLVFVAKIYGGGSGGGGESNGGESDGGYGGGGEGGAYHNPCPSCHEDPPRPKPPPKRDDGCFSLNSYVRMFDLSERKITKLKSGDIVLSINNNGTIGRTEVITIMQYGDYLGNS